MNYPIATFILVLVTPFSMAFSAAPSCNAEAQFVARVARIAVVDHESCKAFLAAPSYFAPSGVCPLLWNELAMTGISFPLTSEQRCSVRPGQELAGVAVRALDGTTIILD